MKCPIYRCQLVRSENIQYKAGKLNNTLAAKRIILELTKPILENSPQEQFLVVSVDTKLKPIGVHLITAGTLDASLVHPREVFTPALLCNAASVFLVHNHPSGDCIPSRQDREVTDRLKSVGEMIGIQVIDHIIVGYDSGNVDPWQAYSLAECD